MHDGTHARLEPGAPMYVSTDRMADAYQVRKLGLPHADEDRLIELIGQTHRLKPYKNDPALRFQLTRKRKLIWVKALPGEQVCLRFDSSLTDDDRAKAIGLLGLDSMVGPVPKSIELTSVPRFEALLAEIEKGWPGRTPKGLIGYVPAGGRPRRSDWRDRRLRSKAAPAAGWLRSLPSCQF